MAIIDFDYSLDFSGESNEAPWDLTGLPFAYIENQFQINSGGLRPQSSYSASVKHTGVITQELASVGITIITSATSFSDRLGCGLFVNDGANAGKAYLFDVNGTSGSIRRRDAATGVGTAIGAAFGFTDQTSDNIKEYVLTYNTTSGDLKAYYAGDLIAERNDTTYQAENLVGGMEGVYENNNLRRIGKFGVDGLTAPAPAINPTGTDTDLINGTSADVVFSGLTSNPASVAVVWDNGVDSAISSTQADFSLGTVSAGAATATVTATIGNLPYTDATYLTADYSYLVTCDDDSEITFDTLTFAPEAGRAFITLASPLNDSTSIIPSETLATGEQIEYPTTVSGDTFTVNADGSFNVVYAGSPQELTFNLGYWDGSTWYTIATTLNISGEVVSGGGLTRVGLTRIGLTTAGLTAVGFSSGAVTVGLIASTYLTTLTEMSNYD